jgi:CRP-like cAMP-binding protein
MVGTAKETAIRFLSELKDEEIISTHGSNITILNPDELVKISQMYD